ncbi:MAG: hypothetical protein GY745_12455 [Actinomycetia bacterium]|nr:hypothetical protein [Actinomycetes bacterium]MCP3912581.1 hypothetical protein [Actinomycetes bacterium]MCP4085848.1 hypothetical protein [Actinomycetes bacterium]
MEATSLQFAQAARTLGDVARSRGLAVPAFRSPPRVESDRSIRRRKGSATVAIRLRGRPWLAVLADMVDGVIVANDLCPAQANELRTELWTAVEGSHLRAA